MADLPPLRALQIFETVGHSQNIQDAARRLGISPGAVSQQLQLLEQHVNAALFFKEGRRLQLTAAGLDFHQRTTEAFELLRDAQNQLLLDQEQRTLHISALPSFLNDWLMPRLGQWQRAQTPEIGLHLQGSHHEPDYANEQVDFRFTYAQTVPQSLHWVELFTDEVLPVCHPDLLRQHVVRQVKDLMRLPLINVDWQPRFSSPPTWAEWFKRYLKESIAMPTTTQSFSLSHQALTAVRNNQGIMLAQRSYVEQELRDGRLCAPFPDLAVSLDWPYVMTWQPSVFNKPHARDFHQFILSQKNQMTQAERPA
ncbi:MAG TPA: LysR family transcriptional regulator [Alcaligenaceae bacterium]|nr:LysR family transcriptional regulator [Alcaligenaceae bacterium]